MRKEYTFKVILFGIGEDKLEAWEDAITKFYNDPGLPGDILDVKATLDIEETEQEDRKD